MSHLQISSAGLLARVSGASFRQVCHELYYCKYMRGTVMAVFKLCLRATLSAGNVTAVQLEMQNLKPAKDRSIIC